jgi:hypothetical protein
MFYGNQFQFAGVIVRRVAYERFGGFDDDYIYVSDWDIWVRLISEAGGVISSQALASYRSHGGSATTAFSRNAENVREVARMESRFAGYSEFDRKRFRRFVANWARAQADRFRAVGDEKSYQKNIAFWQEVASPAQRIEQATRSLMKGARKVVYRCFE